MIRELSPVLEQDRSLKPDIDAVSMLIDSGGFRDICAPLMPSVNE